MDSLPRTSGRYSEFDWGRELPPFPSQCSTPGRLHVRLTRKPFRGEPDIPRRDWPFTPTHRSSDGFARPTGSGLRALLRALHPAHG